MTNKFILLLYFSLAYLSSYAQSFTASVSTDSILIGNYIKLSFVAENIDGSFEAPTFSDLDIISGPNTSSSIQIINGDKTSTQSYTYYIKPTELGLIIIPPAYFESEDNSLESLPIELNVYPNPENIIIEPKEESSSSFFQFGNLNPFKNTPQQPATPTPPTKPKRKYKKI